MTQAPIQVPTASYGYVYGNPFNPLPPSPPIQNPTPSPCVAPPGNPTPPGNPIPEPGTLALLAIGLLGLALSRRAKRATRAA